jgi:anti-sigma regulatory factor (Ser/Thr protein kinase)
MIADWERQRTFEITEPSHTAEVRRFATQLAQAAGFNESEAGGVALVTTELATNLLKHASSGEIVVRPVVHGRVPGVELLALDRGLGISNLAQCLRDGYSTAGSPGTGLGAIARLATEFDIQSQPGKGTAVMARLRPGKAGRCLRTRLKSARFVSRCRASNVAVMDGRASASWVDTCLCWLMAWVTGRVPRRQPNGPSPAYASTEPKARH